MVPHQPNVVEINPLASASGIGLPLHLQLNMPLKSPLQALHELLTHNAIPLEIQQATTDLVNYGEEEDDESTIENFKSVAREAYLSPIVGDKSGKKE